MIDFSRWIYSGDLAKWIAKRDSFDTVEQMNYICSAPHRTLQEKIVGLRELYAESGEKIVADRMNDLNGLRERSCSDRMKENYFFQQTVFCKEQEEPGMPMI